MFRSAFVVLALAGLAAVPSAQACDCGGCPPATCGTTSVEAPGSGLLFVRPSGQRGPLRAFDVATGRRRFSLPPGVASADGTQYFAPVRRQRAIRAYDARTGRVLFTWQRRSGSFVAGVSANGQKLALARGGGRYTRFAMADVARRSVYATFRLRGWYDVDAVANDGRRLFLIQYLRSGGYRIRLFDLGRRVLTARVLTEKGEPMDGIAWNAVAAPDGHRLLTLYLRGDGRPEVHTLDLVRGTAVCMDLPNGNAQLVQQYTLALSRNGDVLYAANPALGVVATLDLRRQRVIRVDRFPARAETAALAPSAAVSHDGRTIYFTAGRALYAYDAAYHLVRGAYDAGAPVGGIAFGRNDRQLVVVRLDGKVIRLDAATGRTLR
jgi:outer membrane protein assembly factor BamB